jgi:nucleoside phosphorylase
VGTAGAYAEAGLEVSEAAKLLEINEAIAEAMEGGGVAQVGVLAYVPFLELRAISNQVGAKID